MGICQSNKKKDTKFLYISNFIEKQEAVDFLTNGALFSSNELDSSHHYIYYKTPGQKLIGPPYYPRCFIQPFGWTAIALNVSKKYDNGDDRWLGNSNLNGEWYIGYHGIKEMGAIHNIYLSGFRRGPNQECENYDNINPLTKIKYPKCGVGAYFAQDINDALYFTSPIEYSGHNYRVVFMARLNPQRVRIAETKQGPNRDYMIVNGDLLDDNNVTPKIDEVRPYKILLIKEKKIYHCFPFF